MKPTKAIAALIFFAGLGLLWIFRDSHPVIRLGLASVGLLFFVKLAALAWQLADGKRFSSPLGFFAFLFAWPGVLVDGFEKRDVKPPIQTGDRFLESWLTFLFGAALLVLSALLGRGESTIFNYLALFSILLIVHLGLVEVVADGLRLLGFAPKSLFDRPFLSASLREFWGNRWNRAFVDMNKLFILKPLKEKLPAPVLVFSIFMVSGVLHELAISYADGMSWGFPLLYFLIQGFGVLVERKYSFPRIFVLLWVIAPVPLLFTLTFTNLFLGSLCKLIYDFLTSFNLKEVIQIGLVVGALMHFMVLSASLQAPSRLNWKADFQKLQSLNRKVFWTYGAYVLTIIIFMGGVSFYLFSTDEFYTGAGKLWILFIALFWWARILIDFFYMSHTDWPQGALFKVGHVCLSTLFVTMTLIYTLLAGLLYSGAAQRPL